MTAQVGITGAKGVLGRRISESLARRGVEALAFSGDVADAEAVATFAASAETIVHCAAIVPTQIAEASPAQALRVNVEGTINIAAAARRHQRRLVYVSSSHVYRPSAQPLREMDEVSPISAYGLTKLQGEQWAARLSGPALIARVFSFFDSRQSDSFLIPALIKRIGESERGARLPLHGASNVRDIAAASHLADLIAELALSEATGVVNCGVGFGTTILDLARLVAAAMDRSDVEWQGLDDSRPSTLVADTSKLAGLIGPRPAYDVAGALSALAGPSPT